MIGFYLLALLPIIVGGIVWLFDKNINWWEWLIGCACSFLMAGAFHLLAIYGMTDDIETWSGHVTVVNHCPRWVEQWEEMHTRTVGSGKNQHTEIYYTTEYDVHLEHWQADLDFGSGYDLINISEQRYDGIKSSWGGKSTLGGVQGYDHFSGIHISGDQNYYSTYMTVKVWPVTTTKHFQNKIKAAPSVFSFVTVPTNVPVFGWPSTSDTFASGRVMGTANNYVSTYWWDVLNASVGPAKKINLIIVGFSSDDEMLCEYQKAKWIGGKKNDLVIALGGKDLRHPTWANCFGWTESEIVKQDVSSYLMKNGLDNGFIQFTEKEIRSNYRIKDWKKFDYISIEVPTSYYFYFLLALIISQAILYIMFDRNPVDR